MRKGTRSNLIKARLRALHISGYARSLAHFAIARSKERSLPPPPPAWLIAIVNRHRNEKRRVSPFRRFNGSASGAEFIEPGDAEDHAAILFADHLARVRENRGEIYLAKLSLIGKEIRNDGRKIFAAIGNECERQRHLHAAQLNLAASPGFRLGMRQAGFSGLLSVFRSQLLS